MDMKSRRIMKEEEAGIKEEDILATIKNKGISLLIEEGNPWTDVIDPLIEEGSL